MSYGLWQPHNQNFGVSSRLILWRSPAPCLNS